MIFRMRSWLDVLIHLVTIVTIGVLLLLSFFYIYLPLTTNHGETITVPDLEGMHHNDVQKFLNDRELRYEVAIDSSYSGLHPPLTILKQYPKKGSKVKRNRKIFIWLNAVQPPMVAMPYLIDGTLKNARLTLKSYGLVLDGFTYKPSQYHNAVLEQRFNGQTIEKGEMIPKGSKVHLIVGDAMGKRAFSVPELVGLPFDEADIVIKSLELELEKVFQEPDTEEEPGTVIKQVPNSEEKIKKGQGITIWIAEVDSSLLEIDEELTP